VQLFSPLYSRAMQWARHQHAQRYLAGLSFAESSFFPIPPDVMLAPMSLANPSRAVWFATITTIASVLGGMLGYLIGLFAFDMVEPILHSAGYYPKYLQAKEWFSEWGFWAVFVAGFSPIRYLYGNSAVCYCILDWPWWALFFGRTANGMGWRAHGRGAA